MADNDILIKQLIANRTKLPDSSYENRKRLKQCQSFLRQFHPLEINPKAVNSDIESLCEKLEINSLHHKSAAVKKLSHKLVKSCDYSKDLDDYLMMYGVVLFLLEINGPMVNSCDYQDVVEIDEIIHNDDVNWGDILTKSEDIVSLIRDDYTYDDSDEYFTDNESEQLDNHPITETPPIVIDNTTVDYLLIKSELWDKSQVSNECSTSLQSEYWLDSYDTKPLTKHMPDNNFLAEFEHHTQQTDPRYYSSEYRNRIEISDYQFVREIIDVLIGSRKSFIFNIDHDSRIISKNRFTIARSIKLLNLSWQSIDNIAESFSEIATNCLIVRSCCSFVTMNNSLVDLPPAIVAFADRLHRSISQFTDVMREFESRSRDNRGLSLLELVSVGERWRPRVRLVRDIAVCASGDRFDAFTCQSTVVSLLNLLFKLTNETCLVVTDEWMRVCTVDLFDHVLQPYLYALDALLSGQVHISPENLFLTPRRSSLFDRADISGYWLDSFSFRAVSRPVTNDDRRLLNDIPVLLQPFVVELISTVKAIDLLRLLSTELTKPAILNAIIIEPGRFIDLHRLSRSDNATVVVYRQQRFRDDFTLPSRHFLLGRIAADLSKRSENQRIIDKCTSPIITMTTPRDLHGNLKSNILDRYRATNTHLISTFIGRLGLGRALEALKSIFFFQAGVEMYSFCCHVFDTVVNCNYESADLALSFNLKLQQVLSESTDADLRAEAHRFIISLPSNSDVRTIDNENALPFVSIEYEVDWQLRVVISDEIVAIANKCFRFLLQLRFSKHCLEARLHSERSAKSSWGNQSNRACSLRLKLLQIVNSFHVYVMNTFVVPSWGALEAVVHGGGGGGGSWGRDFTDFVFDVAAPFRTMLRGCLQSSEMATVEQAIRKVVLLGVEASRLEVGGDGQRLRELEDKYNKLIDFIAAMFRSLAMLGISIGELDISAFK